MTPEQKILLRQTFESLMPMPKQFGRLFYDRLFALDPTLRGLFKGDLDRQASMLANALMLATLHLTETGRISRTVHELGERHRHYGVPAGSYGTFGEALLWTLEQRLGEAFTPAVRAAWKEAYGLLAEAMRSPATSPAD